LIQRPVVRSFAKRFTRECAAWVRSGGHAILWASPERARLVLPHFGKDDKTALARWAILDLGKTSYGVAKKGALRGLVTTPIPSDSLDIVRDWATRDSVHRGPLRAMKLDCRTCGSCCRDNEVILEKTDFRRARRARILEKLQPPYTRRLGGKLMLRVLANGRCTHLGPKNSCGIYTHRPDACRYFPAGSECCLFAREEELGIVDGARD
jgi:hypothetical protein